MRVGSARSDELDSYLLLLGDLALGWGRSCCFAWLRLAYWLLFLGVMRMAFGFDPAGDSGMDRLADFRRSLGFGRSIF